MICEVVLVGIKHEMKGSYTSVSVTIMTPAVFTEWMIMWQILKQIVELQFIDTICTKSENYYLILNKLIFLNKCKMLNIIFILGVNKYNFKYMVNVSTKILL